MTIFWRCEMCSPRQSRSVKVPLWFGVDQCYRKVVAAHAEASPTCIAAKDLLDVGVAVDFLIRMVQ